MNRNGWMAVAAGLGVVAGMRNLTAPAMVSRRVAGAGRHADATGVERLLAGKGAAGLLSLLAAAELLIDKSPSTPPRTRAPILATRAASGAVSSATVAARHGGNRMLYGLIGAAAAVAAAYGFMHLRRRTGERFAIPDAWVGLAEDAISLMSSFALTRRL